MPCDHSISEVSCQSESVPYCALSARLKLRPYGAIKICLLLLLLLLSSQIYQSGEFDAIIVAQRSAHIAGTTVIKVSGTKRRRNFYCSAPSLFVWPRPWRVGTDGHQWRIQAGLVEGRG